ncbi:MAG: hypothetical protein ACRDIB_02310 [Ardenticatenaceae bacterium]
MDRFLVFARTQYEEPLSYQGELEATAEEAGRLATERFGDWWLELVLIPEDQVEWVLQPQTETEAEAGTTS